MEKEIRKQVDAAIAKAKVRVSAKHVQCLHILDLFKTDSAYELTGICTCAGESNARSVWALHKRLCQRLWFGGKQVLRANSFRILDA